MKDDKQGEEMTQRLAEAGFYFFGYNSVIGCFSCGLNLTFDPSMDLWNIHGLLSSKCEFVVQQKGEAYLQTIKDARQHGMLAGTIVTFKWREFGMKQKIDTSELVYRPYCYIAKHRRMTIT